MSKVKYDLNKFTDNCDKINDIAQSSPEGKDAVLRVVAQILHDDFGRESIAQIIIKDIISETCQELCDERQTSKSH